MSDEQLGAGPMLVRFEAVNRLTATTARADTLEEIYAAALDAVERALGVTRASILLFDADGVMRFKAWHGLSDRYRRATEGHSPWSPNTANPEPITVTDAAADESLASLRAVVREEGIAALAFFPLIQRDRVIGKFMAYYDAVHDFSPVDIILGRIVAGHVAFAVERQRREEVLRDRERDVAGLFETRRRLAAIVDSSDDAIISKTPDGIIQTWNISAERLFGYRAEEVIGRSISILIPPDCLHEEAEILGRIRRGERVDHYETVRRRSDRRQIDVSLTVSPILDASGAVVGASKIARDITEWKRVQKEREQLLAGEQQARAEAEAANHAKDEFLATLSHELRTPLSAILGWAQVLRGARDQPGMVERALETITRNAKQQARLIEDLLDLSSIMGGRLRLNLQPVDLVGVVAAALETIGPAAEAKQVDIRTDFAPSVGLVQGDPERLQQVFWNLLSNAVKFTPRQGHIEVRLQRRGSRAVVVVSDTGIGIRQDMLPVIFERFRQADSSITRAHGGVGLGLAIVQQVVEMHGGTVEASSPGEGHGSTFTILLPVAALQEAQVDAARAARETVGCHGIHTLLVDDEADGREILSVFLEHCGAQVTAVGSAREALAAIERRRPDVLVSDLAMPQVDGYELIRRVRALPDGAGIPAIALTAHANADARVKAFRAGFDTYMTKPVDPTELVAVIVELVQR
jgi:PAS domain S-box-containing protein